jgi:hypothetical protein
MTNQKWKLWIIVGILVLTQMACNLTNGKAIKVPNPEIVSTVAALPTTIAIPTISIPTTEIMPTLQAAETAIATNIPSGVCLPRTDNVPQPSGLVKTVTMAEGTQGDNRDPVNPTMAFKQEATFHAVVAVDNAPDNSAFKAVWYADDTNGVAECNTKIDEYELTTSGSRNLDFSLKPTTKWPTGRFSVEIYVNGVLDQVVMFVVQ